MQVKDRSGEKRGKASFDNHLSMGNQGNDARKNLMNMLDSAKAKLDEILQMKFELVIENCKTKQAIEQVNLRENDFTPELRAMDIKRLEEEFNALLSDKAGETEYLEDSAGPNCETEGNISCG
ncbi:uncharacterized protein [Pyrus communis]|uniref:uncharacterized protein isoform X1 n=2 Tax=Pyrus communis TaxID=23211 RepID=UPI0035C24FC5